MEIQLQELIDQIKKDGVETAEAQAAAILETAKADAEKIIAVQNLYEIPDESWNPDLVRARLASVR